MDVDSYIKNHFDDFIEDYGSIDNIKNIGKGVNIKKNIVVDNSITIDDDNFYSREEIYGEYDDDDDSIEENEYQELPTIFNFNENGIQCGEDEINKKNEDDYDDIKYDEYMEKMINSDKNKFAEKAKEEEDEEDEEDNDDDYDDNLLKKVKKQIKNNTKVNSQTNGVNDFTSILDDPKIKTIEIIKNDDSSLKSVKFNNVVDINEIKNVNNIDYIDDINDINDIEEVSEMNEVTKDDDKGHYMINVINLFMLYFNDKYNKQSNFMTGIKNNETDTNDQMEMFMTSMTEYEYVKEKIFNNEKKTFYFENKEYVVHYLDDDDIEKFYVLILLDKDKTTELKRIYSPSLLDCLNYLYENSIENNWNIYDLK